MSLAIPTPEAAALAALARMVGDAATPALRASLAESLLAAGKLDDALHEATACLALAPECVPALLVAADSHARQGAHEAAAMAYARAAALTPGRPRLLVSLASALMELDRLEEAERVLCRAVALAPDCTPALANLASVLVRRGKLAEAELPCRAALVNDPDLVAAHQNMSAILAEADPPAARAHRDAAYKRQHIFVTEAPFTQRRVLVLAAADLANTPLRHLFDRQHITLIFWYVEYAEPGDALPPYDLIFNAIGEPELAPVLPACVRARLTNQADRLLNPPAQVARTTRDALPALLAGIDGIIVPAVGLDRVAAAAIGFPLLVRPRGTHGGNGLRLIESAQQLAALPDFPAVLTRFHDFRAPDGFWRKYRVIFVDRRPYPLHLAISPHWLVHHCTAGMEHDATRRDEERRFLADWRGVLGPNAAAAIEAIGQRLDLDYAGIDFSLTQEGQVLVFEANAAMLVHPEPADGPFAYRNQAVTEIQNAFAAMLKAIAGRAHAG